MIGKRADGTRHGMSSIRATDANHNIVFPSKIRNDIAFALASGFDQIRWLERTQLFQSGIQTLGVQQDLSGAKRVLHLNHSGRGRVFLRHQSSPSHKKDAATLSWHLNIARCWCASWQTDRKDHLQACSPEQHRQRRIPATPGFVQPACKKAPARPKAIADALAHSRQGSGLVMVTGPQAKEYQIGHHRHTGPYPGEEQPDQ